MATLPNNGLFRCLLILCCALSGHEKTSEIKTFIDPNPEDQ